ncbi:MAG TPA: sensor histidine kinase [bacterium]|jgi:signal transduction histidine kinase|nr:sensor histidine kinase [bacterium]
MAGLRTRMAAWTALIALVTTGGPGYFLTWRAYKALSADAYESQLNLAHSLAAEIDDQLSESIGAVEAVASRPSVLSRSGALVPRLALVASTTEQLDDLLVADWDGDLLGRAPRDEPPPDFSLADRMQLVRLAEASQGQTISLVHTYAGGQLVLRLARAMGKHAAAMGQLRLESQGIGNLEGLRLGTTGFAYLADDQGRPLVLPTLAKRLGDSDPAALAFGFSGKDFVREEDNRRGRDLLAVAPLESLGWAVAVRRSLDEAQAPARRMLRDLVVFIGLAMLLSGMLVLAAARPLVNNLLALAAAAGRIEAGELDSPELGRLKSTDEVGQVAGALAHLGRALEAQKLERERALARTLQAEKRLAANERLAALGQLAAGLAHELNNPLMVIHGAAAEAGALSRAKARPWLERVRRESERCSRLVRELLEYARPRPPRSRAFDMALLCREVFDAAGTGRDKRYELRLVAPKPVVRADRDQFQQVLLNLFSNAMDAMPAGGPLDVKLAGSPKGWRLTVRDAGPGVPARSRETIFRPFFTSKPKGTGLGLAIARNLVHGHAGSLRCLPQRGAGACFEVRWMSPFKEEHG